MLGFILDLKTSNHHNFLVSNPILAYLIWMESLGEGEFDPLLIGDGGLS